MNLPLTKTLSPFDYAQLQVELSLVDSIGTEGQHEHRRWEYAMALRAFREWRLQDPTRSKSKAGSIDVGGAGSNMSAMLSRAWDGAPSLIVDPKVNMPLEEAVKIPMSAYVVTCISTVEHVEDEWEFLSCLDKLVRPGGLLFITMDCGDVANSTPKDIAHFAWMRERLYNPNTWSEMAKHFIDNGYRFLGEQDFSYQGHQLFASYSFASLALVKKV